MPIIKNRYVVLPVVKKLPETVLAQNIDWADKYVKLAKIHKDHQESNK